MEDGGKKVPPVSKVAKKKNEKARRLHLCVCVCMCVCLCAFFICLKRASGSVSCRERVDLTDGRANRLTSM